MTSDDPAQKYDALPDERLQRSSRAVEIMRRPELGALFGLVVVIGFFLFNADPTMFTVSGMITVFVPASQLGILAIGAALLMIGGEFDLSLGSMIAAAGLTLGILLANAGLPLAIAIAVTFAAAAAIGIINGLIVIRTRLPSFIVTLAFLFILRGLTLIGLKWATGGSTQLRGLRETFEAGPMSEIFSGVAFESLFSWLASREMIETFANGQPKVTGIPVSIIWFAALTVLATWVLLRTRMGNWIFAAGGDPAAARASGVPVDRVKIALFVVTACAAALVAILTVLDSGSTDARRGLQKEFEAIIAAVIGGCLLTGGYGSAVGAAIGAVIFGMVLIGLSYTSFDSDWFPVFLGGMLLIAVTLNSYVRRRFTKGD